MILECKQHLKGDGPELARFWVESHHGHFKPELIKLGEDAGLDWHLSPEDCAGFGDDFAWQPVP